MNNEPMSDERLAQLRAKAEDALPILSAPGSFPRDVLELIAEVDRLRVALADAHRETLAGLVHDKPGELAYAILRAEKAEAALARVTDDSMITRLVNEGHSGAPILATIRAVAAGEQEATDA